MLPGVSLPHVIYRLKQFSSPNSNVCGIPTPLTQIQDPCWSQWPYVLGNCVGGNMFWEICVFYFHSSVFIFYTYIPSLSSNQSRHVNYLRNFHKKLVIPNTWTLWIFGVRSITYNFTSFSLATFSFLLLYCILSPFLEQLSW